jgi:hypothetical protein
MSIEAIEHMVQLTLEAQIKLMMVSRDFII